MDEQLIDKTYFTSLYKQIRLQEFLEVAHTILLDRLENGYGKTVKGVPLGCLPVELFRDHFSSFRSWRSYTKDRVTLINGEKVSVQHLYFTFNARSGFPTLSSGKEWVKKRIERKDGTDPLIHEYQKVTFIISYRDTRVECDFKMASQAIPVQPGQEVVVNPQQQQNHQYGVISEFGYFQMGINPLPNKGCFLKNYIVGLHQIAIHLKDSSRQLPPLSTHQLA
eukprot:gene4954-5756_t